ncbi:hypothetical protein BGZ65_000668, partial [Modicella reniformis]
MVVPLEDHARLRLHKVIRFIDPCQAPDGREDSFHPTDHRGYTIKYPGDFEHRNRDGIKRLTRVTRQTVG